MYVNIKAGMDVHHHGCSRVHDVEADKTIETNYQCSSLLRWSFGVLDAGYRMQQSQCCCKWCTLQRATSCLQASRQDMPRWICFLASQVHRVSLSPVSEVLAFFAQSSLLCIASPIPTPTTLGGPSRPSLPWLYQLNSASAPVRLTRAAAGGSDVLPVVAVVLKEPPALLHAYTRLPEYTREVAALTLCCRYQSQIKFEHDVQSWPRGAVIKFIHPFQLSLNISSCLS